MKLLEPIVIYQGEEPTAATANWYMELTHVFAIFCLQFGTQGFIFIGYLHRLPLG